MQLVITPGGILRCVYGEAVDLSSLGRSVIARASHVEPDQNGSWRADLSPVGGPVLGPFSQRSVALVAERAWLERHWLVPESSHPSSGRR